MAEVQHRAALNSWPWPVGLDEDELDEPGYRPRCGWLPATGAGVAGRSCTPQKEDHMPPRQHARHARPAQHPGKETQIAESAGRCGFTARQYRYPRSDDLRRVSAAAVLGASGHGRRYLSHSQTSEEEK